MFTHEQLLNETVSLKKFAYKLTRNQDDAEDLLQSTVVTALAKQHQFEQGTNLFSWMSRIMFNTFVSGYRHSSRYDTQYDPQSYIDQETIDGSQEEVMDLSLVGRAMMSLTEDHQEILRLVCIDGMQYAEVAAQLQIPVGTVRSRLSRAREALQERLKPTHKTRIHNEAVTTTQPALMDLVAANHAGNVRSAKTFNHSRL